jgi:hypothetical protein
MEGEKDSPLWGKPHWGKQPVNDGVIQQFIYSPQFTVFEVPLPGWDGKPDYPPVMLGYKTLHLRESHDPCLFYAWGAGQLMEGYANMRIRGTGVYYLLQHLLGQGFLLFPGKPLPMGKSFLKLLYDHSFDMFFTHENSFWGVLFLPNNMPPL